MDPVSGFFNDVKDHRLFMAMKDDVLYLFGDVIDVIPGDAGDRLDLVLYGGEGVLLGKLEHEVDLVLHLVPDVRLAKDVEFVRCCFFYHLEFV